jgi:hypothetical protein
MITQSLSAQKLSKKEAKQLLEASFNYLKMGDSISFVNMWYFDNTSRPATQKTFAKQAAYESFYELRSFLDTALAMNLPFNEIDVEKMETKFGYSYKIKGWFEYDKKKAYYKGYGFLLGYYDNRWAFRCYPETSISYRADK